MASPLVLPPSIQDRIERLSESAAMHIQFSKGEKDVRSWDELRLQIQEGITKIIEAAKK